jgi:hypothetical protein
MVSLDLAVNAVAAGILVGLDPSESFP